MKKISIVLSIIFFISTAVMMGVFFSSKAIAGGDYKMKCANVGSFTKPIERCENEETVCYYSGAGRGISCIKK